jgi:hypothetical protein
MFSVRGQNLIIIVLIMIILTLLATLSYLKLGSGTALAQEGDQGGANKSSNYEAVQAIKSQVPNDVAIVEEGNIDPQSDGSGIEVVPIAAFKNDGDSGNGWFHSFSGGYIENQSSNLVCFIAPTYPPNGATLTGFRFSLTDDSPTNDLFVFLERVRLTTGVVDTIAGGSLAGRDNPTAVEAVDNSMAPGTAVVSNAYAYYVDLCFDANTGPEIHLYGARVFYTP